MMCRPVRAYGGNDESPGAGMEGGKAADVYGVPEVILRDMCVACPTFFPNNFDGKRYIRILINSIALLKNAAITIWCNKINCIEI